MHETTEENGLQHLSKWFFDGLEECALMVTDQVKTRVDKRGRTSGSAETLLLAMRRNLVNLRRSLSLQDIHLVVADFQRCWMDLFAMLQYYQDLRDRCRNLQSTMGPWDVNPNWMGVFTDKDSLVLSLWEAGVPVWHIRKIESLPKDLRVGKRVSMKWDPDIETNHDPDSPHTAIYTGFGGEARAYLCRLIGNLALGNYIPLLSSEIWDNWV